MKCDYSCKSAEHELSRRSFLGNLAIGAGAAAGFGGLPMGALAAGLEQKRKQILMVWLHGGVSQLESWDPKPGTDTGGPFRAIETSVPGIRISELLPKTAKLMHHLSLLRSINIDENAHNRGAYVMHTGRKMTPGQEYPHLGSVAARFLAPEDDPLPGYIHIRPGGGGFSAKDAAYLGPKYGALLLGNGNGIADTELPSGLDPTQDELRHSFRCSLNDQFALRRRTAATDAYTNSYEQALQLMERKEVFDVTKESEKDRERYGSHDFGRHCLLARRLLEAGVRFVTINTFLTVFNELTWDIHGSKPFTSIEGMKNIVAPLYDQGYSALIEDLADRGMLDDTLVCNLAEFGRTPKVNPAGGRDHWPQCFTVYFAGGGIQGGRAVGASDPMGGVPAERPTQPNEVAATIFHSLGFDLEIELPGPAGRPFPIVDFGTHEIKELF